MQTDRTWPVVPSSPFNQQPNWLWLLAALAIVAGLAPILLTSFAPLQDWPSHLARTDILDAMLHGPSPWDRYYTLNGFLLPNEATDFLVVILMQLGLTLYGAAKGALILCYALFVGGYYLLAKACGAGSPFKSVCGAVLFYNGSLFFGLVNFEFGLALLMGAVAVWLATDPATRPRTRFLLATIGTLVIFLCHLIPAVLYVGTIGLIDLFDLARLRARTVRGMLDRSKSVVALAVLAGLYVASPASGDAMSASWTGVPSFWAMIRWKLSIAAKTLLGGGIPADVVMGCGAVSCVVVAAALFRPHVEWRNAVPFVATLFVAIAAPTALGTGSYFDYRLAVVPILFGTAALSLEPRRSWSAQALCACTAALLIIRSGTLTVLWRQHDAEFQKLDDALAQLPAGGVLLGAIQRRLPDVTWQQFWSPPSGNIASLGVHHGLFVPTVFAIRFQQTISLKPAYQGWSTYAAIETPRQLEATLARAAPLCAEFPSGAHLLVLYTTAEGLPGMSRIGTSFGLLDACEKKPPS